MHLGLPPDLFLRELAKIVAYAALGAACLWRLQHGRWAMAGAAAGVLGAVLQAYTLFSFVLYVNGASFLIDLRMRAGVEGLLGWLDLAVVVGLVAAVLLDRTRDS